ncbi:MAG: hypothetical protein ABGZ23_06935 [Fuerstiella sp.]|nr:hypothetical protein [Fuerstiella sp.]
MVPRSERRIVQPSAWQVRQAASRFPEGNPAPDGGARIYQHFGGHCGVNRCRRGGAWRLKVAHKQRIPAETIVYAGPIDSI